MRLYSFTNMYLSSIQCGLQTAHLVGELFSYYCLKNDKPQTKMLYEWSNKHRTICILNGGNCKELTQIHQILYQTAYTLDYPFSYFKEDRESLNEAITCVGIIIPESVYMWRTVEDYRAQARAIDSVNDSKSKLIELIRSHRLAT